MLKEDNRQQFKELKERLNRLESAVFGVKSSSKQIKKTIVSPAKIDFDIPIRAFIKKYAKGMSGPKKFTLLLSWFVKGDLKKEMSLKELEKNWNKMTAKSLLRGKFNRFYPAEARANDWVDLRIKGFYNLRPSWSDIFYKKN